ncbi:MAG: succinate dehydrogenase cytochrome b subunit [Gloeobacteraceae cyanobacterium ES-bin-144]|nr:succinate dehydrogenase cytochrome b subunit [Verrucomicrobiales bacterium]
MNALTRCLETYWSSSIGKKLVVALTGIVLVLFLAGHLIGNLVVFMGPEAFNSYAYLLHHMLHGMGIWLFRIVMLVTLAAHIIATIALTRQNRAARKSYEHTATIQASKSSRTMILSGLTILAFVVYHMLHFTARIGNEYNTLARYKTTLHGVEGEVHNAWLMVIDGFQGLDVLHVTAFYVIAMTLLCSHLMHGVGSIFQTLGLRTKKSEGLIKQISIGYSLFIWLGFISIPLAINLFPGYFEALAKATGH